MSDRTPAPVTGVHAERLDELERLAKSATPGPWRADMPGETEPNSPVGIECPPFARLEHDDEQETGRLLGQFYTGESKRLGLMFRSFLEPSTFPHSQAHINAAYVSAVSPDVVLALVGEVRRLRADVATTRAVLEQTWDERDGFRDESDRLAELIRQVEPWALVLRVGAQDYAYTHVTDEPSEDWLLRAIRECDAWLARAGLRQATQEDDDCGGEVSG